MRGSFSDISVNAYHYDHEEYLWFMGAWESSNISSSLKVLLRCGREDPPPTFLTCR